MKRIVLCALALTVLCAAPIAHSQVNRSAGGEQVPSMPSTEEVNDLLSKASEYVAVYDTTFKNAKATLDKSPTPGFPERATELCSQANTIIGAIKKNGMSAYALVALVGVLDDMSLNAARASAIEVMMGLQGDSPDSKHRASQDMVDLAQAGKNCYDISELILHSTLRYIAVEENLLKTLYEQQKSSSPTQK
jgi:hypothetical protein